MQERLDAIESKLDELLKLTRSNTSNLYTLYRRTTALAQMVEAVAEGREPRLPKVIRAEIDASINPEAFEALSHKDPKEFVLRYGTDVLEVLQKMGIEAITRIGDFAPLKSQEISH